MKKLAALMISVFMMAAAGQAFAVKDNDSKSVKVCILHYDNAEDPGNITVQTKKNAEEKHCSGDLHNDVQIPQTCCQSNAIVTDTATSCDMAIDCQGTLP